jgi:hypothetical protein
MFRKAERKQAKLRLCLAGPSGSGKTYSSIQIARGLGGKIAMIDTEHGSGELYAHLTDYDIVTLDAPYSPERYIECIKAAEKAGYTVLIIDSLTHAWSGEGGILEMVDKVSKASRTGNSYTAWRDVTPWHNKLVEAILTSNLHIITTMRTKTEYVVETNEKGKTTPRKVGMAPVQRDGMEYEFTAVLDLSLDGHFYSASKDRTGLFDGKPDLPSEKTGRILLEWLNSGKAVEGKKEDPISEQMLEVKAQLEFNAPFNGNYQLTDLSNAKLVKTLNKDETFDYINSLIIDLKDIEGISEYHKWKSNNKRELARYIQLNKDDAKELSRRFDLTSQRINKQSEYVVLTTDIANNLKEIEV